MFLGSWHFRHARHPLARLLVLALGVIAVAVVLAFGFVVVAALAVGGAVMLLIKALRAKQASSPEASPSPARPAPAGDHVIEGEFTVTRAATRPQATSTR